LVLGRDFLSSETMIVSSKNTGYLQRLGRPSPVSIPLGHFQISTREISEQQLLK
jgi:hypothetical protein